MPPKTSKPKKTKLQVKTLSNLRTLTMVKGPGNFSTFKPPVDVDEEDEKKIG